MRFPAAYETTGPIRDDRISVGGININYRWHTTKSTNDRSTTRVINVIPNGTVKLGGVGFVLTS